MVIICSCLPIGQVVGLRSRRCRFESCRELKRVWDNGAHAPVDSDDKVSNNPAGFCLTLPYTFILTRSSIRQSDCLYVFIFLLYLY